MARNEHKKVLQQLSEAYQKVVNERIDPYGSGEPDYDEREERERRKWEVGDAYGEIDYDLRGEEDDEKPQQKFKIFFTTALNPDFADAEGWISHGTDKEDAWDNLHTYFKNIPPGPGYRGRNLMSFWHVQIEPYEEGDPCADAMGPCQDITAESEDDEYDQERKDNIDYARSKRYESEEPDPLDAKRPFHPYRAARGIPMP